MNRSIVATGIILLVLGVILGAFGAHALKEHLSARMLSSYEVGIRYQIYMAIGMMMVGFNASYFSNRLKLFYRLLLLGVILFSGSIYGLSLCSMLEVKCQILGPITPIGGMLIIFSWIWLLFLLLTNKEK